MEELLEGVGIYKSNEVKELLKCDVKSMKRGIICV